MIRISTILFFLSMSVFSQNSADSLGTVVVEAKEELQSNKTNFQENVTQENRDNQYLSEIMKSSQADDSDITKKEIDIKFSEKTLEPEEIIKMEIMSLIIDPNEINVIEPIIIKEPEPIKEKEELTDLINDLESNLNNRKRVIGPSDYDTRIELLQLKPDVTWQLAIFQKSNSVAMIVEKEKVNQISKEIYTLDISRALGATYNLCPNEAFYNQPIVGTGTAFIISENSMITAKHVFDRKLTEYIIIFGFRIVQSNGVVEVFFDKNNLYYPTQIKHSADELDIIEFEVDRDFNRPLLEWEQSLTSLKSDTNEIYMIGHPSGLPMKVALNASIGKNPHVQYFYTTLDSYQGNSGSPVFNFYTHKVIGVLVAGEKDYHYNGNCYYSSTCSLPYCMGEKVIRIEEIMNQFKN